MNYEDLERRVSRMLEELESEDEVFDDVSDQEDNPVEISPAQDVRVQSDAELSDSDDDNVPLSLYRQFLDQQGSTYTAKDGTVWSANPPVSMRTRFVNIIREQFPKVMPPLLSSKSPTECYSYFISDELLTMIVNNTNKFIRNIQPNYSRERDAREVTITEIRGLIGLLLLCGVRKCSRMNAHDLYNTNGSSMEIARLLMSERRFLFILRSMRFDDKDTRTERIQYDKLAPIREFWNEFVKKCKEGYAPSPFVTVDEMLPAFRGKCNFRQYIPSKPNKYGIKIQAAADAKTFYTFNMEVYVGTQPDGPFYCSNKPTDVVIRLCEPISGSGRNVTTDNWYSSCLLTTNLLNEHNLTSVGTLRKNKTQIPPSFCVTKGRQEKSSVFGFQNKMTLVSYVPKRGKLVLLLSSMHLDDKIDESTGKPDIVLDYNITKSGVDVVDKLCSVYNTQRNTRRWPMVLFYTLINIATVNAQVIFEHNNEKTVVRRKFIEEISYSFMENQLRYRYTSSTISQIIKLRIKQILNISENDQEASFSNQVLRVAGRCYYCDRKKNRKTKYSCFKCGKHMCLGHVIVVCRECSSQVDVMDNNNE